VPQPGLCTGLLTYFRAARLPACLPQVWQDAVSRKSASPYLVHELPGAPLAQLPFVDTP